MSVWFSKPKWYYSRAMNNNYFRFNLSLICLVALSFTTGATTASAQMMRTGWERTYAPPDHPIVLHAARLLDIESGKITAPGEVLVRGDKIAEVGQSVTHPLTRKRSISATLHSFPD